MWVCLNSGFVSIVRDAQKKGYVLVRARRKAVLQTLCGKRNKHITRDDTRDYRWRISVEQCRVGEIINDEVASIDYTNFKKSVKDKALHTLYLDFWVLHSRYQREDSKCRMV